jgi:hypothetical protein
MHLRIDRDEVCPESSQNSQLDVVTMNQTNRLLRPKAKGAPGCRSRELVAECHRIPRPEVGSAS